MIIALFPLLVAIIGLLMWALCTNGKLAEAGKILFFCGALVLVWSMAGKTIRFG